MKSKTSSKGKGKTTSTSKKVTKKTSAKVLIKLGEECEMCGRCCNNASGFLIDDDMKRLAKHLGVSIDKLKEKYLESFEKFNKELWRPKVRKKKIELSGKKVQLPYGACIFLKDNMCSIHEVKPLQCNTASCKEHGEDAAQWFALNYFVDPEDPQSVREWSLFLEFNEPIEGGDLGSLVKDKELRMKMLEYGILKKEDMDELDKLKVSGKTKTSKKKNVKKKSDSKKKTGQKKKTGSRSEKQTKRR